MHGHLRWCGGDQACFPKRSDATLRGAVCIQEGRREVRSAFACPAVDDLCLYREGMTSVKIIADPFWDNITPPDSFGLRIGSKVMDLCREAEGAVANVLQSQIEYKYKYAMPFFYPIRCPYVDDQTTLWLVKSVCGSVLGLSEHERSVLGAIERRLRREGASADAISFSSVHAALAYPVMQQIVTNNYNEASEEGSPELQPIGLAAFERSAVLRECGKGFLVAVLSDLWDVCCDNIEAASEFMASEETDRDLPPGIIWPDNAREVLCEWCALARVAADGTSV